jgi:RHS repeat-associated protein
LDLTNPSQSRYYILDALGHTRLLLDNTGNVTDTYVYDAWGNLLKGSEWSSPNPFTWNGAYGYEWIEFTGLFHVGAREYDPRTARWLQRDPIDVAGGDPNLYLYCHDDPLNGADPSGLDVEDDDPSQEIWKGFAPNSQDKKKAELNAKIYRAATVVREALATAAEVHPAGSLAGAIYGKDCYGEPLKGTERVVNVISVVPGMGVLKVERIVRQAFRLKKAIRLIGGGLLKEGSEIFDIIKIAEGSGIDIVDDLIQQYGGTKKHWKKMKGFAVGEFKGKTVLMEVHWYECHGIGKVRYKNKRVIQWIDKK